VYEEHYRSAFFDGGPIEEYEWPFQKRDGRLLDMRRPQQGPEMSLHYAPTRSGWLAFTDLGRDVGMVVSFDPEVFRYIYLWIVRGRRGYNIAAVMPFTGYPARLHEAAGEKGVCARIPVGEALRTSTVWTVYRGLTGVAGMDADGTVVRGTE
jgi:hypothetical protein